MTPVLSIVVCTFNRAPRLKAALEALLAQTADRSRWEVVVVDNRSTDGTREVVRAFETRGEGAAAHANGGRAPVVRYAFEERQGLSHARNRGWREARGRWVGYTDDDCLCPPGWVQAALEVCDAKSPGVFGGPYHPFYETPKPPWFRDAYGAHDLGPESKALDLDYLTGGNIFFRRDLLQEVGEFDPDLGMKGGALAYGEESALLKRVRAARPSELVWYEPRLAVRHLVPATKMTARFAARSQFAAGRSGHRLFGFGSRPTRLHLLVDALREGVGLGRDLVHALLLRDRARFPHPMNHFWERGPDASAASAKCGRRSSIRRPAG